MARGRYLTTRQTCIWGRTLRGGSRAHVPRGRRLRPSRACVRSNRRGRTLPNARIELESGRKLSREEEQEVKQTRGRAVRSALQELFGDRGYAGLDDDSKRVAILRLVQRVRTRTTRGLRGELN